jgi:hypothetical protein
VAVGVGVEHGPAAERVRRRGGAHDEAVARGGQQVVVQAQLPQAAAEVGQPAGTPRGAVVDVHPRAVARAVRGRAPRRAARRPQPRRAPQHVAAGDLASAPARQG